eukprot:scaffold2752_cov393-Prasinococcus_capsulatus_cf.AAC.41
MEGAEGRRPYNGRDSEVALAELKRSLPIVFLFSCSRCFLLRLLHVDDGLQLLIGPEHVFPLICVLHTSKLASVSPHGGLLVACEALETTYAIALRGRLAARS